MSARLRFVTVAVLAILVGLGLVVVGLEIGSRAGARGKLRELLPTSVANRVLGCDSPFSLQEEVLGTLRQGYYRKVDAKAAEEDAIRGMLAGLDDAYTVYLDPEEYRRFREHTSGSYSGVGMAVEMKGNSVTVVSTFKGTPAQEQGINPGDIILAVDGKSIMGLGLEEVVARIKGREGTSVRVQIYRPSAGQSAMPAEGELLDPAHLPPGGTVKEYNLRRTNIAVPVVETELLQRAGKKVDHIRFFSFSEHSSLNLRTAVKDAIDKHKADAIVLDLRSNGGGMLDEAVNVASLFIPSGVIVTTQGLNSPKDTYRARGSAFDRVALYVLVDRFSASASEIVAGALKDNKQATILGETTFGKGLVQSVQPLSNGGALKMTAAVYYTPSGRDINKKGIEPDVKAPDDPDTPTDETLEAALDLIATGRP